MRRHTRKRLCVGWGLHVHDTLLVAHRGHLHADRTQQDVLKVGAEPGVLHHHACINLLEQGAGNDLHTVILPHTNARVSGAQVTPHGRLLRHSEQRTGSACPQRLTGTDKQKPNLSQNGYGYIYIYMYIHIYIYLYVYMYRHMYMHMFVCVVVNVLAYIDVSAYVIVHVYVCVI